MAIIQEKIKLSKLSLYSKKKIAHAWFHRGTNFLLAAKLLEEKGGYHYVVLHLICQGLEIIIKSLLLMQNYDKYKPKLKGMGHDLIKSVEELNEFVVKTMKIDDDTIRELEKLNGFYRQHYLRYGNLLDIFKDPKTIPSDLVMKYAFKLVRFGKRRFKVLLT